MTLLNNIDICMCVSLVFNNFMQSLQLHSRISILSSLINPPYYWYSHVTCKKKKNNKGKVFVAGFLRHLPK